MHQIEALISLKGDAEQEENGSLLIDYTQQVSQAQY